LVFLLPYSPMLNLIEGLWRWLKDEVVCNVFFTAVMEIRKAVQGFLAAINQTPDVVVDRLCV